MSWVEAAGLALGFAADRALGDPARHHPVAWFGSWAAVVERRLQPGPDAPAAIARRRGAAAVAVAVAPVAAFGVVATRVPRSAGPRIVVVAAATWVVLGGRSLEQEVRAVTDLAATGELAAARARIKSLVGRDATTLGPDEVARACVESLAENGSDAVVAPLLWGAVAGVPGLLGYRALNTLDAMWGHRSPRYVDFGWAAARLDDVVNLAPARLTAALTVALAWPRGRAGDARRAWRQDSPRHPSPNAGPIEATFAGALGRSLGGTNSYDGVAQHRGRLGQGPPVSLADVGRAVRLARGIQRAALVVAVVVAARWPRAFALGGAEC